MLFLLIDYAKQKKKNLFVGFLDYEKAFDCANRAGIMTKLMNDGCGGVFTKSILEMFSTSTYYPKSNIGNRLSVGIDTDYGVTQGRRSSGSLFSYYVSDMALTLNSTTYDDFMDPLSLAQLEDDSAIYAEKLNNLATKFIKIFDYSDSKHQVANISKTMYCNFAADPILSTLQCNDQLSIESVNRDKGYKYLGTYYYPTNDITDIIKRNVNKRMGQFSKFYAWLSVNENTPVDVKIMILDNCVFGAILYGCECWGNVSYLSEKLKKEEMKAIRSIMGIKIGTTEDLVFHELRRCSVMTTIKDRQFNFYKKVQQLSSDDAIVKVVLEMCLLDSSMVDYYKKLREKNREHELMEREQRILKSNNSMCRYYCEFDLMAKCDIYCSMLNDYYRIIITRWRLSNHRLNIEVGRYAVPKTQRANRVCSLCHVLEDEEHVVFTCPRYQDTRSKYPLLLDDCDIKKFLNPRYDQMIDTACFIRELEKRRTDLAL